MAFVASKSIGRSLVSKSPKLELSATEIPNPFCFQRKVATFLVDCCRPRLIVGGLVTHAPVIVVLAVNKPCLFLLALSMGFVGLRVRGPQVFLA